VEQIALSVPSPSVLGGASAVVEYAVTLSSGDAANATLLRLVPYIDGLQYGAEVGCFSYDAMSSTARGTGILSNPLYVGQIVFNRQRFIRDPDTRRRVSRANTATDHITAEAAEQEAAFPNGFKGWSTPGASGLPGAAWLEMTRCIARRAERSAIALASTGEPAPPEVVAFLNRLSDLLWLCARREEQV
jgi:hypothetical protein